MVAPRGLEKGIDVVLETISMFLLGDYEIDSRSAPAIAKGIRGMGQIKLGLECIGKPANLLHCRFVPTKVMVYDQALASRVEGFQVIHENIFGTFFAPRRYSSSNAVIRVKENKVRRLGRIEGIFYPRLPQRLPFEACHLSGIEERTFEEESVIRQKIRTTHGSDVSAAVCNDTAK